MRMGTTSSKTTFQNEFCVPFYVSERAICVINATFDDGGVCLYPARVGHKARNPGFSISQAGNKGCLEPSGKLGINL